MRAVLSLLIVLLSGCSVGGAVSAFRLDKIEAVPVLQKTVADIHVTSGVDAGNNQAIGAFNWGSYRFEDQQVLKSSIHDTLATYENSADARYGIAIHIHRYSQVVTNASYASLVVVDWALHENGKVVFDEAFYAGHETELNIFTGKTLGWAKDVTNRAIVSRIVNRALAHAAGGNPDRFYAEENVYLDADSAIAALPETMRSTGGAAVSPGSVVIIPGSSGETNFDDKALFRKLDWEKRLFGGSHLPAAR